MGMTRALVVSPPGKLSLVELPIRNTNDANKRITRISAATFSDITSHSERLFYPRPPPPEAMLSPFSFGLMGFARRAC